MLSTWEHEDPEIDSHQEPTHKFSKEDLYFKILQIWSFDNKKYIIFSASGGKIPQGHRESNPQHLYRETAWVNTMLPVCCVVGPHVWSFVIYRKDWSSIKFGENDSFRKLFLFFENTFQYLGGISQDISGSHFDSRRSLSSTNRRQIVGDLPGWFFWSALLSLVICMTGRSDRSARALRDGADVVQEAIGN